MTPWLSACRGANADSQITKTHKEAIKAILKFIYHRRQNFADFADGRETTVLKQVQSLDERERQKRQKLRN
jgi:hypothetical protein